MSESSTNALVVNDKRHAAMEPVNGSGIAPHNPTSLVEMAISQNFDLDRLKQVLEMKRQYDADEARKAYDEAFAAFKAESVQIVKNITVSDGPLKGKKYADLFAVVAATTSALSKHGLSSFWRVTKDEPTWIEVTCTLRHKLGHSETTSMGGPPDTGGAKNAIQARASTKSYLERYTLLAITGLAACGEDNDANGAGGGKMGEQSVEDYISAIQGSANDDELKRNYQDAFNKADAIFDKRAKAAFIEAKNARYKQLHNVRGMR